MSSEPDPHVKIALVLTANAFKALGASGMLLDPEFVLMYTFEKVFVSSPISVVPLATRSGIPS